MAGAASTEQNAHFSPVVTTGFRPATGRPVLDAVFFGIREDRSQAGEQSAA
jgi:hypothetical protein